MKDTSLKMGRPPKRLWVFFAYGDSFMFDTKREAESMLHDYRAAGYDGMVLPYALEQK